VPTNRPAATDPHDLERFVAAQASVFADVIAELAAGLKQSHWMWFIFPQVRGLGSSPLAHRYGIASRAEAQAYVEHPLLGARLEECTGLMLRARATSARAILGSPDDLKFRSSMTLFATVARHKPCFQQALDLFFGGQPDERTMALL